MTPRFLTLDVVTPERPIVHEEVDEVQLPGAEGALGILPRHAPLLAQLQPGELWYRKGNERQFLSIEFGLAEVLPDRVTVLATLAERPEEIDVSQAETARRQAEEEMRHSVTAEDAERARLAMMTALVRMRMAERARIRRGG
jgi:F-type H+-transporting ATPase subunit epsilon